MTTRQPRILPLVMAAAVVLLAGCTAEQTDGDDAAQPEPSVAVPSGVGPYPDPVLPDTTPSPTKPTGSPKEPHGGIPIPDDVDQGDADAVATGALTAMYTYDTAVDESRVEASRRMVEAGWCTAAFGAKIGASSPQSGPGATWTSWMSHRAYTTVAVISADTAGRPADTPTTAYRQWTVTITPHGRDNWTGKAETYTAFLELVRSGSTGPWRLNSLSIQ